MEEKREIFIGSSKEGLKYAEQLRFMLDDELKKYGLTSVLWKDKGVFVLGEASIESLFHKACEISQSKGYAIMIITPDDEINYRKEKRYVPRDNVVFELGLFIGCLGRKRTFCVTPSNIEVKMMSDWSGVTDARYTFSKRPKSEKRKQQLESAVADIVSTIQKNEAPKNIINSFINEDDSSNKQVPTNMNVFQEIEKKFKI